MCMSSRQYVVLLYLASSKRITVSIWVLVRDCTTVQCATSFECSMNMRVFAVDGVQFMLLSSQDHELQQLTRACKLAHS
jgi:hypothetical protein